MLPSKKKKNTEGLKMEKKKDKEEIWMPWRDTKLFDGGTSQDVDFKKIKDP